MRRSLRLASGLAITIAGALVACSEQTSVVDAARADSGNANDAGQDDAGVAADFGPGFVAIAPCNSPDDYMRAAGEATVTAGLGGPASVGMGIDYRPRCLEVAEGTILTIEASATHPLVARVGGTAPSPIPAGPSTTNQTVTFWNAGFYPYECTHDGAAGMQGVVWVPTPP